MAKEEGGKERGQGKGRGRRHVRRGCDGRGSVRGQRGGSRNRGHGHGMDTADELVWTNELSQSLASYKVWNRNGNKMEMK